MKITVLLKAWLVKNCDVKADASDDEFRKAASDARMIKGTLTPEKFAELSTEPEDEAVSEFSKKMDGMANAVNSLVKALAPSEEEEKKTDEEKAKVAEAEKKAADEKAKAIEKEKGEKRPTALEKMVTGIGMELEDDKRLDVRVKEAAEMYSSTTKAMVHPTKNREGKPHPMAGQPVMSFSEKGRVINEPSERDLAVAGSFAKSLCQTARLNGSRTVAFQALPQHDKELLCYALENEKWGGCGPDTTDATSDYADIVDRKLTLREQKALIDDSTSGGTEAAPIVFDDQVIQAPLLHGELFPMVNVVPLDRGRRVEGVSTGTVTGSWGGVDDSAISLFNTASYVSAFDTTIYRWEGAIRIGLDFLSDTPIDFGRHITQQYGERLLEDLDDVIAVGNGTNRPEGVMNKSGATSVSFGGSTSIGNYESLRFSIPKNEMGASVKSSAVFCGTETSYERMKALNLSAADARRLFAGSSTNVGTYDDYAMMGKPYKINETLANTQIFFAVLARYRMYRRRGLVMRSSTEGDTLIRANSMLLVAMARFGGQMERGAPAAVTTTAPS